jgi:hypothetical protein
MHVVAGTTSEHPPSERQRRHRERLRRGRICVAIEVDQHLIDALIGVGRLGEGDETDREMIRRALEDLFARLASCVTRVPSEFVLKLSWRDSGRGQVI